MAVELDITELTDGLAFAMAKIQELEEKVDLLESFHVE